MHKSLLMVCSSAAPQATRAASCDAATGVPAKGVDGGSKVNRRCRIGNGRSRRTAMQRSGRIRLSTPAGACCGFSVTQVSRVLGWVLIAMAAPCLAAKDQPDPSYFAAVQRCVEDEIAARDRADARPPRNPSSVYLEMFVFDAVRDRLRMQPGTEGLPSSPPDARILCADIVQSYTHTQEGAQKELSVQQRGELAALGGLPIESTSTFMRLSQNHLGIHWSGHADLTHEALKALAARFPLHAHTSEYASGDFLAKQRAEATGQESFLQLLGLHLSVFAKEAENGRSAEALFHLGVLSHMVQDLVYHRGMTMREHSGLAYLSDRNPDFPPGEQGAQRADDAVQATRSVMESALSRLTTGAQRRLAAWEPPVEFDFARIALRLFPEGEDINIRALAEYYLLASTYGNAGRPLEELEQDDACSRQQGRACWRVNTVLQAASKK
jgi:hypothetical protein